jgi:hypothetical protein
MAKITLTTLSEQIVRDVDDLAAKLQKFLVANGVKPKNSKLSSLIEAFDEINIIKPDLNYIHFTLNKDGYIVGTEKFGAVAQVDELPADIFRGYYKVENSKLVLDEKQRQKLWEVS